MVEHVIYRKYRPKSFSEVVGQDHIVAILQNAMRLNRIAHAYLFSGPRGTGKTTVARLLAKTANCEKPQKGAPCNTCVVCMEFTSGHTLDLVEIDAASTRGIDDIRELRDAVRLSPARAKHKVYIIDEVHMLTKEAFNALLKTLEEPPAHALFVLATTELEKVPDTIISRCQHFEFRKIPTPAMIERLAQITKQEGITAEKSALQLIAFFADGGLRDAESMLGQVLAIDDTLTEEHVRMILGAPKSEAVAGLISFLAEKNASGATELIIKTIDEGIDPQLYIKLIIHRVRSMLLYALNPRHIAITADVLSEEEQQFLETKKQLFTVAELERMLKIWIEAYWTSFKTVFPQLPLELAIVDILRDSLDEERQEEKTV